MRSNREILIGLKLAEKSSGNINENKKNARCVIDSLFHVSKEAHKTAVKFFNLYYSDSLTHEELIRLNNLNTNEKFNPIDAYNTLPKIDFHDPSTLKKMSIPTVNVFKKELSKSSKIKVNMERDKLCCIQYAYQCAKDAASLYGLMHYYPNESINLLSLYRGHISLLNSYQFMIMHMPDSGKKFAGQKSKGKGKIQNNPDIREFMISHLIDQKKSNKGKLPYDAHSRARKATLKKFSNEVSEITLKINPFRLKDLMPEIKKQFKNIK